MLWPQSFQPPLILLQARGLDGLLMEDIYNFPGFTLMPYVSCMLTLAISYECVGIATCFSVANASSALHKLVTVFHWV